MRMVKSTVMAIVILFIVLTRICLAEEEKQLRTFNLDEIVVTATKTERILAGVAQDVNIITEEQIKQSNAQTVGDLLKYTPGLDISQHDDYPGASTWKATLRGLSIDEGYGLFLVNGERVKGRGMGEYGNGLNQIPVEMIERIEIVKGPGSVLYGSDALAGVINIITKSVSDRETFSAYTDYGTKKTAREGFSYSNSIGKSSFRTSGCMERTDYGEYEGRFLNNRIYYQLDENKNLNFDIDLDEQKTPTNDEKRVRLSPKFDMSLGKSSKFTLKGYWYDWDFVHSSRVGDIYYNQLETQYTRFILVSHKITTGFEFLRQKLDYKYGGGDQWPLVRKDIDTISLYLQDEWFLSDNLYLLLGTRLDSHSTYGEVISPRLSGLLDITDNTRIRASIGRSFKSPTIRQLFYPAPFEHGKREYIISNPDLKPEYGMGYSAGIEKEFGNRFLGNITIFKNDIENMVTRYYTGETYLDKPLLAYENVAEAYSQGFESELKIQLIKEVGTYFSYTFTNAKNKETGKKLRYLPENTAGWRLNYENKKHRFGINWGLKFVSSMYKDNENTEKTDQYFIAEAKFAKEITTHASISFEIDNIFNSDYGDPSVDREGRMFMGKLGLNY